MSTPNTPPEPHTTDTTTDRPGPCKRASSLVAWYMPELTGAAVSAGAAATVWAPLGVISGALAAWIATDQVNVARAHRRTRREVAQRAERAQLDTAEHTADDQASATESASGEQSEDRSGWEVAG